MVIRWHFSVSREGSWPLAEYQKTVREGKEEMFPPVNELKDHCPSQALQ